MRSQCEQNILTVNEFDGILSRMTNATTCQKYHFVGNVHVHISWWDDPQLYCLRHAHHFHNNWRQFSSGIMTIWQRIEDYAVVAVDVCCWWWWGSSSNICAIQFQCICCWGECVLNSSWGNCNKSHRTSILHQLTLRTPFNFMNVAIIYVITMRIITVIPNSRILCIILALMPVYQYSTYIVCMSVFVSTLSVIPN